MNLKKYLKILKKNPANISFQDTIVTIDEHYDYQPIRFINGKTLNERGENSGSCKIFSFGQLHKLTELQVLQCFGDFYRKDVLKNPSGVSHQNIRSFIKFGWLGIEFRGKSLTLKQPS